METIKLDLIPGKKMPSLHASQYDDGRDYHIDLTENRVPYVLDGTETISLTVRKCDNTLVTMDIANTFADKSYIEFRTTEQMNACAGFNYGEITIEKNGTQISSLNFYLQVEGAPDEGGITSQSEINNLNRQIDDHLDDVLPDAIAEEVPPIVEQVIGENYYDKEATDEKFATKTELSNKADVSAIPTKTSQLQNDSNFAQIDDTEASASKTYSSNKITNLLNNKANTSDVNTALATKADTSTVTAISNRLNGVTEGEVSKNIYPTSYLKNAEGITYSGGVFSGLGSAFRNPPNLTTFKANTQYTIQATARKVSGSTTTGDGLLFAVLYSDGTLKRTYFTNNTTSFTKRTFTTAENMTVSSFYFGCATGASTNTWELKEVQVEEGTTATPYMPAEASTLTAIDKVARTMLNELPWWSRFQNEFLRIAYSAIWVDKINTACHWLFASDMGFNVLKGDVEITSDGELIMCHDAGFTFDENGRIINYDSSNNTLIADMTYAECRSKFYADNPQRYGGYCPVADIDDFIRICKDKGKICFLTIRATNTASVVAKAIEKIKYYGMESRTILNAVQASIIDVIRANHDADGIAVNFVAPEGQAITTDHVDRCIAWGNAFLSIWFNGDTTIIDDSLTAIAYARTKNVPLLACTTSNNSRWNYLIEKGIMGCQLTKPMFDVEPKNYRFTVSVSSGVVSFGNLFASNRFTGTATLSGTKIYVSNVFLTNSYLTDVIDGIQPIKMNMLNPQIRCFDSSGNVIPCVWDSSNNRFELTLNDTNDNTYRVLVTV